MGKILDVRGKVGTLAIQILLAAAHFSQGAI